MGAIERRASRPYKVAYRPVPLDLVANVEKPLPLEYLPPEQNDIRDSYRSYVEPLLGGALLRYPRLQ
jgi:6-phosphofructokinase 1